MTRYTPQWLQQGTYAASVDRRLIGFVFPTGAVAGCKVSVASGMTVNIAAGQVAVPTQNNTGATLCSSDATEQVALTAAPAAGQNRYDVIVCQPRGNDLDGGGNNDFVFTVVTGTAAASPTVPTVPAGQYALAQIYVPGGSASVTTGNITDRRNLQAKDIYARAHLNANTAFAAATTVPFNTATRDPLGMFSSANKGFTVPAAGHYLVSAVVDLVSTATAPAWGQTVLYKNGLAVANGWLGFCSLGNWDFFGSLSEIVVCNAGDSLLIWANGGNVASFVGDAAGYKTYFTIQYLHP